MAVLLGKIGCYELFSSLAENIQGSAQLSAAAGLPPSSVLSNKNIKIKLQKAKHSRKKDFIFSQVIVNYLYLQSVEGPHSTKVRS